MNGRNRTTNASVYEPLSSVWEGRDAELLERMFSFYPTIDPEPILDATHNAGRFWVNSSRNVWSMDIDPTHEPRIVADNRTMIGLNNRTGNDGYRVRSNAFGTVVYDPPHVGPQGRDKSVKRFDTDYGATMECGKQHDWTLSYLYPPFLEQAKRVLSLTAYCWRRSQIWLTATGRGGRIAISCGWPKRRDLLSAI